MRRIKTETRPQRRRKSVSAEIMKKRLLEQRPDFAAMWNEQEARKDIGEMLTDLRTKAGLTQRQVAAALQCDQARVSRIESVSGPFPTFKTVHLYVAICGAKAGLKIVTPKRRQKVRAQASG